MSAHPFALRLSCCCLCWLLASAWLLLLLPLRPTDCAASGRAAPTTIEEVSGHRAQPPPLQQQQQQQHEQRLPREERSAPPHADEGREGRGARPEAARANLELEAYDEGPDDELDDEDVELNVTAEKSKYLGSPCDFTCNPSLQHVFCDPQTKFCECEKLYPVQLGPTKGCAKPKKLGEQCLYRATCVYTDLHSTCTQVQHNAVCECEAGYHRVGLSKSNKKLFCAADLVLITTDLPTLLGVFAGIAVFTGLICFVLKLFSRARYTRPRHYANAGHAPPMLFSSDTGIPLTLHGGRPSSRSSQRGSGGAIGCVLARKPSSSGDSSAGGGGGGSGGGARGPLVPASRAGAARAAAILLISCHRQPSGVSTSNGSKHRRALSDVAEASSDGLGSRRPSLASLHSSTSSAKSYSARRLERERNEKEQRQALVELKFKHQHQQQQQQQQLQLQQQQQQAAPTPSPRTPHSTDELLPAVEEATEIFYNEQIPTTSGGARAAASNGARPKTTTTATTSNEAASPLFEGDATPCTSTGVYR